MSQVSSVAEPEVNAPVTAPTPAAPAAPAVPEVVTAATFDRDIGTVSPDVLAALTPKWQPPKMAAHNAPVAIAPVVPSPEPAPVVEPEPPVTSEPEIVVAEPTVPVTEEAKKEFAKNWRQTASDAQEALVFQLHKNGVSLKDAMAEVYGAKSEPEAATAAPTTVSQPEPTVDPVAEADQQITTLANQIGELEVQIDKAAEDGDAKTAGQLTRKQTDAKLAIERAKEQRESMRQEIQDREVFRAVESHRQLEQQSLTEMYERYPELAEKSSEKRAAFNIKVAQMEKSPAYGPKFRDTIPGWPLMVAQIVDAEKGWSRNANPQPAVAAVPAPAAKPLMNQPAPKTVAATPPVSPLRATSAEVITPSANSGGTTPQIGIKDFWQQTADQTPDQLKGWYQFMPPDPKLLNLQRKDPRRFDSP